MPSSDYKHKPGGGLKLKGGGSSSSASDPSKKKKKKSSTSKKVREGDEEGAVTRREQGEAEEEEFEEATGGVSGSASTSGGSAKTKAELKFEEVKRQRLLAKASKAALKSHKERVAEFNEQLEAKSEHYDIPKASSSDPGLLRRDLGTMVED
ncbi:hypothetical protein JCM5353_007782 [Sporobolomyces roseus]